MLVAINFFMPPYINANVDVKKMSLKKTPGKS